MGSFVFSERSRSVGSLTAILALLALAFYSPVRAFQLRLGAVCFP